jgi:4-diphosphocytidyl-2-C-methyl-D-erythritol kinase
MLRAPAKLTLSLRITDVRDDGYHLLDAEMVTLDLADTLFVDPDGDGLTMISVADLEPIETGSDDLIIRSLTLAGRRAAVQVHKRIPFGAGLGGGSTDAGAILRWAEVTDFDRAATLGADVPFCVVGGRARVTGIGERVEPLEWLDRTFTLLTPPFGCSTPAVYRRWDELGGPSGEHGNDLEPAALDLEPRLAGHRDRLGDETGEQPRLAGSGSTWFVDGDHPGPGRIVVRTTPAD